METGTLTIVHLEMKEGFLPPFIGDANRYNGSKSVISRSYLAKAFYITGLLNGKSVYFFSPSVVFTKTSGMLNHLLCHTKNNKWMQVQDGEQTAHKGAPMFDGGKYPNIAIDSHSKIISLIKEGDTLQIKYKIKKEHKNILQLSHVAIL